MLFSALTLVPLALSTVGAVAESPNRAVHQSIAKRARNGTDISKRAYTGSRWSFYDVGLGACGKTNVASDYIVALNQQQFGNSYPSPFCGKTITMTYQGKTATATIMDSCPGCPYGGLDLSRGLFDHFASEDTGIIYGEWSIAGETPAAAVAAAPTTTSPKPKPTTTTTKWTPPATTEHAKVTTSSKPAPDPATTKAAATTTWSSPAHHAVTISTHHASPSPSSSHKAAKASGSAVWSSSYAAASASSASLASSYASILPSASAAANSTGNGTIAEIQRNLDALNAILVRLSTLIVNALPDDKE